MDPDNVTKAITSKTRFLMPTQLNGRTCNMDRLTEIAQRHGKRQGGQCRQHHQTRAEQTRPYRQPIARDDQAGAERQGQQQHQQDQSSKLNLKEVALY